ncbi:MAG: hypothetical protein HeimC3_11290 [Candidatus Heimdallarchaeota archaeon LC_3]|nr:MAG: hypothetical protein HeimC3_11290 [Candidatus Heimdallarchaeota archaeon LC_3]
MSNTFNNKNKEQPNIQEEQVNNIIDDSDFIVWINKKFEFPKVLINNLEAILFSFLFGFSFYFTFFISDPIFPKNLWFLLSLDFFVSLVFSFSKIRNYCANINENLPTLMQFNKTSYFNQHSILYRISRFLFYYIYALYTVRGFYDLDLLLISIILFITILLYTILSIYYQFDPTHKIYDWYANRSNLIKLFIVVFCIGILGVLARLYHVYSIGTWDEGWFSDIAMRMAKEQNWLLPLYYSDSGNEIKLFDKPPFLFWLGALAINTIGNNSLAVKWSMGVLSGLMGLFGFFIYHHQKRRNDIDIIPKNVTDSKYYGEYGIKNIWELENLDEKPEEEEETSDGFSIGVIFGLLMSLTWFVMFYGRTSYLDPAIVGISALTAVFGVKAIDHWFFGNTRKAFFYVILTGTINAIDLFSKAWQGLIVGPPIALYFILRFLQHFIPKHNIRRFWSRINKNLFVISKDLESEVSAMLGAILALIIFSSLFQNGAITIDVFGFSIDFWGVIIVVVLFFAINSFLQSIFEVSSPKEDSDETPENSEKLDSFKENSVSEAYLQSDSQKQFFRIQKNVLFVILGLTMGIVGGYISFFGFDLIYSRFLEPITSILVTFLGGGSTNGSIDFSVSEIPSDINSTLGLLITGIFSIISGIAISIFSVWMIGIIIIAIIQVLKETIEKTSSSNNNNDDLNPFFEKFSAPWAKGIILDFSLVIPLIPLGIAIGFWGVYLLFFGDFFNRDWLLITVTGIIILLVSFFVSLFTLELVKKIYKYQLKISTGYSDIENYYLNRWTFRYEKFLLFTLVLLVVIIISLMPFMWWIQYLDSNMKELGYFIRKAGELYRDPNSPGECWPQPGDPAGSCITYTWLFFEFYISWRYDFGTSYNVAESLGGFIEPLFIVSIPFFLAGIWAFHKKRNYATLSLYLSWFLLVLFIFVPAKFQLNYYYLAAFFPYFAIAANGIFYSLKKAKSSIHLKDMYERTVLLIPLFLLLTIAQIGPYLINLDLLLTDTNTMKYFLSALILILGLFLAMALFLVRSIPGMFAAMLVTFQIHRYVWLNGWGEFDGMYLILNIILIAIPLYLLRDRIPYRSLFFIGIIVLSGALGSAWWVNWKSGPGEDGFERMGNFILTHDGGNNKSTWIFNEPGARYSIRYYMNGYDPINVRSTQEYSNVNLPFSKNNPDAMEQYIVNNPSVNFFIVSNQVKAQGDYEQSYNWLVNHFIDINPLLGISQGHHIHLFVNPDILTDSERSQLGIDKFQYSDNNTDFNINEFNVLPNLNPNLKNLSQLSLRGNSQFESAALSNNWTGLGSEIDPYIIENTNITSDNPGIPVLSLSDISHHIVIQNNYITSLGNSDSVLELSNIINIEIRYNIFKNSGISIDINSNVDINNNYISGGDTGIQIQRTSNAKIHKNYIDNINEGISLFLSSTANIYNNFISNSREEGIFLLSNSAAIVDNNYLINNTNAINSLDSSLNIKNNVFFDTKYVAIRLISNTNTEIYNNTIQNGLNGITVNKESVLKNSRNFTIENNTISYNKFDGIRISNTTEMMIKGNKLSNNGANGIWTIYTPFLQIINNKINNNLRSGISSISNNGVNISHNTIGKNLKGIAFNNCFAISCSQNRSTISSNHIRENSETGIYSRDIQGYDYYKNVFYKNKNGIYLLNSYHNNIYENSFINNSQQAFSDIFSNNFTYNTKGNYWSDYLGKDENSDGIGDQKYQILGRTDLYDSLPFFEVILMEIQPSEWDNIVIPDPRTTTQNLSINGFFFTFGLFALIIISLLKKKRKN